MSVLIPITGCPSRYLATFATRPSCPTTMMTSSGANMNRAKSARSTVPRRQSIGIAALTVASAAPTASCRTTTSSMLRFRVVRKKAACPRVPWCARSSSSSVARWITTARGASVMTSPPRAVPAQEPAGLVLAPGC